ncbi:MAG TPA: porin, partial [Myxococcota bacterium]|nr:porin [Myxococcota bacterium]
NRAPGVGVQVLWRPNGSLSIVGNQYYGTDTLGNPDRRRVHSDNSIAVKYYDNASGLVSKAAASFTLDAGCEWGGSLGCGSQYFLGAMAYNRVWFDRDHYAVTLGGGAITNPGRYLVLLPPINGTTALSGTPYFTASPGDPFQAFDVQVTADYMPEPYVTFRLEFNHRAATVPYFAGSGGMTPPGGNQGPPGSIVPGWTPDLAKTEDRLTAALLIKL